MRKTKKLMTKSLPSDEHKKQFLDFERLMAYRANFTFASKLLFMVLMIPSGQANF